MLILYIYLIGILDALNSALGGFIALSLIATFAGVFCKIIPDEDADVVAEIFYKKRVFAVAAICIALKVLTPSKSTGYAMLAAYGLTESYEISKGSEDVQRISSKSLKLIESKLDEHLEGN